MKSYFKVFLLFFVLISNVQAASTLTSATGITLKTCDYDAGAICSLTWKGKQFINDLDHGRQLQSASSFDGKGEAFNPTEAGASFLTDRYTPHASSSKLLSSQVINGVLTTVNHPAFWNPVNGQKTSNHTFSKSVQFGFPASDKTVILPNVLQYETSFTIPSEESHQSATFEVLTGYMPKDFSQFWTFDVKHGATMAIPLNDNPGEQSIPVIFSTVDQQYAMGIYSPDTPQPAYPDAGYGRWRFTDTVKWNNVYRINNPVGTYHFKSYVVVGTLVEVMTSMKQLHTYLQEAKK